MHRETIEARNELLAGLLDESGSLDWEPFQSEYLALLRGGFFTGPHGWKGWNDEYHKGNHSYVSPMHFILTWCLTLPTLDRPGIVMWGGVGLGKTRLAKLAGIYLTVRYRLLSPRYLSWPEFVVERRLASGGIENDSEEVLQAAMQADFLVVDDLSADRVSEFGLEMLYSLINTRHGPFIVVMNKGPQAWLADIRANGSSVRSDNPDRVLMLAERIADRLGNGRGGLCMAIVKVESQNGKSYRQEAAL